MTHSCFQSSGFSWKTSIMHRIKFIQSMVSFISLYSPSPSMAISTTYHTCGYVVLFACSTLTSYKHFARRSHHVSPVCVILPRTKDCDRGMDLSLPFQDVVLMHQCPDLPYAFNIRMLQCLKCCSTFDVTASYWMIIAQARLLTRTTASTESPHEDPFVRLHCLPDKTLELPIQALRK